MDKGLKQWKIGLMGFGNVGKAFVRLYKEMGSYWREKYHIDFIFQFVINSKIGVVQNDGIPVDSLIKAAKKGDLSKLWGWKPDMQGNEALKSTSIDILVEVTPTNIEDGEPALSTIKRALSQGIAVVTGNKGPFLHKHRELFELARKNNTFLGISCTSAASLPTLIFGMFDLAGSRITKIEGILNGVCNFVLTQMEENSLSFEEAVGLAKTKGITEVDPNLDIDGIDTATKILIISNMLLGTAFTTKNISVEGIRGITPEQIRKAKSRKKRLKLIGYAEHSEDKVTAGVKVMEIEQGHAFYEVNGTNKALMYHTQPAGEFIISGGASSP
ncbi:MAG: hypothetical protein A2Y62_02615, partial [Candidatus Fischerbacteria bacterium RBG_13_37_8]